MICIFGDPIQALIVGDAQKSIMLGYLENKVDGDGRIRTCVRLPGLISDAIPMLPTYAHSYSVASEGLPEVCLQCRGWGAILLYRRYSATAYTSTGLPRSSSSPATF